MRYSLSDLLTRQLAHNPSKIALIEGNRRATYSELEQKVGHYAMLLAGKNVKRGDRIAIYLPRSIELASALFATWSVGCVGVVINEVLKSRQINYILGHSEASLLITDSRLLGSVEHPVIPPVIPDDRILVVDGVDEVALQNGQSARVGVIGADLALLLYTSGSTGLPKGVMLSHENLLSGARIVSDYLHLAEDDIIISLLPFSFDYGLNQLLSSMLVGGTLVLQRSVLAADICNTLVRQKITGMAAIPMLWQQLAHDRSPFIKTRFPDLRYITNTGGRMPERITRMFRKVHPHVQIFLMFGLTEAFRSSYLPPEQVDIRPASVGKAIPNVELLVINEHGQACKPGEVGELVHRGANISLGYWRDPENTAKRFRPAPGQQAKGGQTEIAVFSGDYVKTDEEGYLYFVGRKDQMIKSRGTRVSPEEIEECLFASNLVSHVVAFSIPKDEVTDEIVAAVVPRNPPEFSADLLRNYYRKEMPEYLRPDTVWQMDQFPQTSSGKPDRVRIRELYIEAHPAK